VAMAAARTKCDTFVTVNMASMIEFAHGSTSYVRFGRLYIVLDFLNPRARNLT
jgi:hypothetical protein